MLDMTSFQFLEIPPKGELATVEFLVDYGSHTGFQFLGIPPKGELYTARVVA